MLLLPLNDVEPNRYTVFPFMVGIIAILNLFILIAEDYMIANDINGFIEFIQLYGTTPTLLLNRQGAGALASITYIFLHGGFLHWASNMIALWAYGRRVEDVCGPWRFLAFYLLCGVGADLLSTLARLDSDIPTIGASGAVYGVMGAYLVLFPTGRIRTFEILVFDADYQVGHWAHLGGFFAGLFVMFFLRPDAFHRYRNDLPL